MKKRKYMKTKNILSSLALMGIMGFTMNAQAAGTLSGTYINNTASLAFSIGGVAQTPKDSNTVSFVVDTKVNLTYLEDNGGVPTFVAPGASAQVFRFKLTNLGNAPQNYLVAGADNKPSGTTSLGYTDNSDITYGGNCRSLLDNATQGTIGTYDPGIDVGAGGVSNLAPDTSRNFFLVCDIPNTALNNSVAVIHEVMATYRLNGGPEIETTGANTAGVDVVFADGAGLDDSLRDGSFSARAVFVVRSATLTVSKTNVPLCDPYNFTTNPKNIPGALVRYSITVTNGTDAGDSALLNTLSDNIDIANLTFDPNLVVPTASACATSNAPESNVGNSFKYTCSGGSRACTTTPVYRTATTDGDNSSFVSPAVSLGFANALGAESNYTAGELKAGESVTVEFNAFVK